MEGRFFFLLDRSPQHETALCSALQNGLNFTAQHMGRAAAAPPQSHTPTWRTLMSDLPIPPEGMFYDHFFCFVFSFI